MSVLRIESVEVLADRIEARVRLDGPQFSRTGDAPGLPERALALLPGLSRHSCENEAHVRFADELADTETPHLLEHVACELMALAGSPRSLRGETRWDFATDGRWTYRVSLAYDDDLVALGALKEAVPIVEWLLAPTADPPDVEVAVGRLHRARGAGSAR